MDFLSQLEARRKNLKATKTIITNERGEQYEIVDGVTKKLKEKVSPFVVDTKPDMQVAKIVEGLYLSSQDPASNEESLRIHDIKHVLSLGIKVPVKYKGIEYHFVDFLDLPEFDIGSAIEECLRIIHDCIKKNVLVHCNAGVSRSATIVVAYLMASEGLSYDQAYEKVKSIRSCVKPNEGFVRQLRNFDGMKIMLPSRLEK